MICGRDNEEAVPLTAVEYEVLGAKVVLYDLLVALDEAAAAVWDDGGPFRAGVREGLDRAVCLVRQTLTGLEARA